MSGGGVGGENVGYDEEVDVIKIEGVDRLLDPPRYFTGCKMEKKTRR